MNRSFLRFREWRRSCMMLERSRNSFKRIWYQARDVVVRFLMRGRVRSSSMTCRFRIRQRKSWKRFLNLLLQNIMESFLIASMKSVMRLFSQVLRKQINRILNMRMGKSNRGYMIWISTCKTPSSRPKKMFSILQDELNCWNCRKIVVISTRDY